MEAYGGVWRLMEAYGAVWRLMRAYEGVWKRIEAELRRPMEADGDLHKGIVSTATAIRVPILCGVPRTPRGVPHAVQRRGESARGTPHYNNVSSIIQYSSIIIARSHDKVI